MRDVFNPKKISLFLNEINEAIPYFRKKLVNVTNTEKKQSLKRILLVTSLKKVIANYSLGESKITINENLIDLIDIFEDAWENVTGQEYEYALWIISIATLCDLKEEYFLRITNKLIEQKLNDKLFSFIIKNKIPSWKDSNKEIDNEFVKKPYSRVLSINTKDDLKNYLDNFWYKENSESIWYDSDKRKNNVFFGYWSWESAAILKIKEIDDSGLKNQKYYPYDAVHW